jgi:predicted RecA/RadA family phage recombinase
MAATNDIRRNMRSGDRYGYPVLAGVTIFGGSVMGITAALAAVPAAHASCVALIGIAEERIDNSAGATGDQYANAKKGIFDITLAGATAADIGSPVYASDDETFTLDAAAGANLQIGTLHAIDADGVWLKTL